MITAADRGAAGVDDSKGAEVLGLPPGRQALVHGLHDPTPESREIVAGLTL